MDRKDFSSSGLIKLTPDIVTVFDRDMRQRSSEGNVEEFLNDIVEKIEKEDPIYYSMIEEVHTKMLSTGNPLVYKKYEGILHGLVRGYEVLRRESESRQF